MFVVDLGPLTSIPCCEHSVTVVIILQMLSRECDHHNLLITLIIQWYGTCYRTVCMTRRSAAAVSVDRWRRIYFVVTTQHTQCNRDASRLFFFIQFWYLRCCGCPWNRGRQHLTTPLKTCHNTEAGFLQGGCSAYPPALYKSIIDIDNWAEHWRMQDQCSARHVHGTDKWPIFSHKTNQLVNRMVYLVLQHSELIWITNGNAVICVSECIRDVTKFDFEHCWTLNIFSVFEIHHILSWLISFFEFVV